MHVWAFPNSLQVLNESLEVAFKNQSDFLRQVSWAGEVLQPDFLGEEVLPKLKTRNANMYEQNY